MGNGMGYANVHGEIYRDVHGTSYGSAYGAGYGNNSPTYPGAYPGVYTAGPSTAFHTAPGPGNEPRCAEKRTNKAKKPVGVQVWEVDSDEEEEIEERHARLMARKGRVLRV